MYHLGHIMLKNKGNWLVIYFDTNELKYLSETAILTLDKNLFCVYTTQNTDKIYFVCMQSSNLKMCTN